MAEPNQYFISRKIACSRCNGRGRIEGEVLKHYLDALRVIETFILRSSEFPLCPADINEFRGQCNAFENTVSGLKNNAMTLHRDCSKCRGNGYLIEHYELAPNLHPSTPQSVEAATIVEEVKQ